jgi:hypothetical protein
MVGHWLDADLANTIAGHGLRSAADTVFGKPMVEVSRIIAHRAAEFEIDGAEAGAAQLIEGRSRKTEICGGAANRERTVDCWSGHCFLPGRLVAPRALKVPISIQNFAVFLSGSPSPFFRWGNIGFPHHLFAAVFISFRDWTWRCGNALCGPESLPIDSL